MCENKLTLKKLAWELDRNFRPPFVEAGLVSVQLADNEKSLSITIAGRDIEIDERGNVIGAGTFLS